MIGSGAGHGGGMQGREAVGRSYREVDCGHMRTF